MYNPLCIVCNTDPVVFHMLKNGCFYFILDISVVSDRHAFLKTIKHVQAAYCRVLQGEWKIMVSLPPFGKNKFEVHAVMAF